MSALDLFITHHPWVTAVVLLAAILAMGPSITIRWGSGDDDSKGSKP